MPRTALTRSLLLLVMSCAIACYCGTALYAIVPVVPQDTTALAVAGDTLSTSLSDTLRTKASSERVSALSATQAERQVMEDSTAMTKEPAGSSEALQHTSAAQISKHSGGAPFIHKMTSWFTRYPNSGVALICSIVPGGGQLYNQRYWKIPIVLSAMTAGVYAVTWNQRLYHEYHTAYADLLSENPLDHTSWQAFIPPGADPTKYVSDGNLRSRLERGSKQYKESRDLSIVITVALYLLSALDAYVDAELYYFNVSPQLTIDMGEGLRDKPAGPRPQSVMVGASVRF
ncbi:DUF5683 domain-containing protein [uncultured Porphyromonas sp.]|uniref:DUF5683 domain-containing protein n=1 Tax=uncultured Porphyromonas sp. TaxID=159274 RepID=UPI0026175F59|nr:DUF5683 domain-containing protein [uncultured Porphyromonas sp.]